MTTINIDLTPLEFKRKAFLEPVFLDTFALKLYLLADKTEELLLSSICYHLASNTEYHSFKHNRKMSFFRESKTVDEIIEALKAFYYRCEALAKNKNEKESRAYWESLKATVLNNWDYFNPNIRKTLEVQFKKDKLRILN